MVNITMKPRYVLLTGAKNNAGDYLIKYRAKQLLSLIRPDREILDYNAWEPLTESQVEEINSSQALILAGGPALQPPMYPGIYPLVSDLSRIKVPILTMAIGWKSPIGTWNATRHYSLTSETLSLLQRIEASGFQSSVRDYHTLNVLHSHGFKNFVMTGCAALYSLDHIGVTFYPSTAPRRITFSLGVSFYRSAKLTEINRMLILEIRSAFPDVDFTVAFHHSINSEQYQHAYKNTSPLFYAQLELIKWLEKEGVAWIDLSGSADNMINHYSQCDFHLGYRVHAHILMASLGKPTLLIAEDGRGTALKKVIGGIVLDGCQRSKENVLEKFASRFLNLPKTLMESKRLPKDLVRHIRHETNNNYPSVTQQREAIDKHFLTMKSFLEQLP